MADLKIKITGDASDAVKAATVAREQIVEQFRIGSKQVSEQKFNADFDTTFRQLTQFRIGLTQLGRGDLGGIPNLIKGIQLAGQQSADVRPKIASLTESVSLLDRSLKIAGAGTTGKSVFASFEAQLIKATDTSNKEGQKIRAAFTAVGIDVEKALLKPSAAFKKFLAALQGDTGVGISSLRRITGASGDITKLVDGLGAGGKAIQEFEQAETAALAATQNLSGGLSLMTLGLGAAAIAAVAAVAGVVLLGSRFAETANELRKLKEETGLSNAELGRLKTAAALLDVDLKTVVQSYKSFNQTVTEVRVGNKDLAAEFKILGVNATEAAANPRENFEKLVLSISNLKDEGIKAKVAQDLLKISLGELAALAKVLTEENGRLSPSITKVTRTMSPEELANAEKYTVQMNLLKQEFSLLGDTIGAKVLPPLNTFLEKINKNPTSLLIGLGAPFAFDAFSDSAKKAILSVEDIEKKTIDFGNSQTKAAAAVTAQDVALKRLYQTQNADKVKDRSKERQRALDQAAQDELSATKNKIQEAEAIYREERDNIQRSFDRRIIDEDLYTARLKEAIEKRSVAIQVTVANERDSLANSGASSRVSTKISAAIDKDEQARIRERVKALSDADFASTQERLRFNRAIEQAQLSAQQVFADREISLNQDRLDRGVLAEQEAASRELAIALRLLDAKIKIAQEEVERTGANSNDRKIAQAELEILIQQRINIEEAGSARVVAARKRDIASARQFAQDLADINAQIADIQVSILEGNADQNTSAAVLAVQARAELERRLIEDQFAARQKQLAQQIEFNRIEADDDETIFIAKTINAVKLSNVLIAEAERRREAIRKINAQEKKDLLAQNATLAAVQTNSKNAIAAGLTGSIAAYASGASSIRQAAASFYNAALQPLTDYLNKKAFAYFQESIARFVIGDFVGGAKYGAAGVAMAAAAGFIGSGGAVSAAIGGTGGANSGTSQLGSDLSSTRADDSTRSTEEKFRLHERGQNGFVTTIVLKTDRAQLVKDVSYGVARDFAQGGATKKVIRSLTHGEPIF